MTVKKKKGENIAWPFGMLVPLHKLIKCIINFFNPKSFASSEKTEENILGSASFCGLKHPTTHRQPDSVPASSNKGERKHWLKTAFLEI